MFNIFRRAVGKRGNSVEENLRWNKNVAQSVGTFGLFLIVAGYQLDLKRALPNGFSVEEMLKPQFWQAVAGIAAGQPVLVALIVTIGVWFYLYLNAVGAELDILRSLYSDDNLPHDWERTHGRRRIRVIALMVPVTFYALVLAADNRPVFCAILLLMNVVDAHANNILRRNLAKHFSDPRYDPPPTDWRAPFILRRRAVAADYWINRPQVERIGAMMMGTAVVVALSALSGQGGYVVPDWVTVGVIIGIVVANEVTMDFWRTQRDRRLDAIQDDEDAFEGQRAMAALQTRSPVGPADDTASGASGAAPIP
jgi:hypothetical protein